MAKTPKLYQRLTRNSAGLGSYSSLWLAPDHIMIVRSTGYNESYSRVQLRDIKAVFLTRTRRRIWWAIPWGVIAAWSGAVVILSLVQGQPPIVSAIFLGLALGALAWNHLLGPGCRAHVVTGVQSAELPSLVRMKRARAVLLLKLEPLIVAAQADLMMPTASSAGAPPAGSEEAGETPVLRPPSA
jgi:hypothetical protein